MPRTLGLLVVAGALLISVAGCAPLLGPVDEPSAGSGETVSPTPTVTATVTPTKGPDDIPFQVACTDLVGDQLIYDWGNGNWAADPDYQAAAGSSAGAIVEKGGTACGWVNLTSGERLSVAVGQFVPEALEGLRQERADSSDPVSDFGDEGYFEVTAGTGQADVFTGAYWITASSTWFLSTDDARDIVQAAISATA